MRKIIGLFVLCLGMFCLSVPAFAQNYTFSDIHASFDLPEDTYDVVLTPGTLSANQQWLSEHSMDPDATAQQFAAEGILLKAYDTANDRTFIFSALQTVDAQMYFDLNQQDETMRKEFRVSHTNGSAYGILGYNYSSAVWSNYGGTTLRFLSTQYTLKEGNNSYAGYQKRTIRNGYTITLDMQVQDRKAKEADLKALETIMKTFAFTQVDSMPQLPAKLSFSAEPPAETNSDTFTLKGKTEKKADVNISVIPLSSGSSEQYTLTANGSGNFSQKIVLPQEGVYTVSISAKGSETLSTQVHYTVTYQKGLLSVTLTSQPNAVLTDTTVVSGTTLSGVKTQLVVDGPNGYHFDKSTSGSAFKFSVNTAQDGEYTFNLTLSKKGLSTRAFQFKGTRALTRQEMNELTKKTAVSPAYSTLKNNLSKYESTIITYSGTVTRIEKNETAGEWLIVFAQSKSGTTYKNFIYVVSDADPGVSENAQVKLYGTVSGEYTVLSENATYPRCELLFFENAN